MSDQASVAIVDYGLGNVFSVLRACETVGLPAILTSSRRDIESAPAVILPGVGAFGDAMATLERLDLVSLLRDTASSGKPLWGICLGLQLLMDESQEFGSHKGLGIVSGDVVRLPEADIRGKKMKVPQVGWSQIYPAAAWEETPLEGLESGAYQYFVHSFYVRPVRSEMVLSTTRYGDADFCSSLRWGNVFASQFHPERSGPDGLAIYSCLARQLRSLTHV